MKNYALIRNGIVINRVVLADGVDPAIFAEQADVAIELPDQPEIGWTWDGKSFAPPSMEVAQPIRATLEHHEAQDVVKALIGSDLSPERIKQIAAKLTT